MMPSINLIEYIDVDNASFKIIENLKYEDMTEEMCLEYFEECKMKNNIIGEYKENVWKMKDETYDIYVDLEFQPELGKYMDKLKCFILMKIYKQNIVGRYTKHIVKYITRSIVNTYYFNDKYIEDYRKYIIGNSNESHMICVLIQFLDFIGEGSAYIQLLKGFKCNKKVNRDIPGFESIIMFDKIVDDVILHHKELYQRFYSILLWWKVSTIVPMRPSEFIRLKRNCVYEKNNEFYLHIERTKNKYDRKIYTSPVMTEFLITREMYDFVKKYVDYANTIDNNEYLVSREVYINGLKLEINNERKVNSVDFARLLKRFFYEVVDGIYGLEVVPKNKKENDHQIECVNLGDTRHLAIINLMMQGVNPLDIMKLAGHHSVETQMGYYSHVEKFMTSKTYVLSKMLKNNKIVNQDYSDINSSDKKIERDLMGANFYSLPVVAYGSGRCKNTNFPQGCEAKECIYCKYFLPEGKMNAAYLEQLAIEKQQELDIKKNTLKFVLENSMLIEEQELERASKDYITVMNQNVVIQSYRLREENVNT